MCGYFGGRTFFGKKYKGSGLAVKNIFKDAMSNIFSNKPQEEIPLELDVCVETDDVVRHLFRWAYNTETIGQLLFWMVMLLVFPAFGTPISEEGGFLGVLIGFYMRWLLFWERL